MKTVMANVGYRVGLCEELQHAIRPAAFAVSGFLGGKERLPLRPRSGSWRSLLLWLWGGCPVLQSAPVLEEGSVSSCSRRMYRAVLVVQLLWKASSSPEKKSLCRVGSRMQEVRVLLAVLLPEPFAVRRATKQSARVKTGGGRKGGVAREKKKSNPTPRGSSSGWLWL